MILLARSSPEHFAQDNLRKEIFAHHYPLQYTLYSLALHRYLQMRLKNNYSYERDFGGVCYLFFRGMTYEKGEGFGVYHDRLPNLAMTILDSIESPKPEGLRP